MKARDIEKVLVTGGADFIGSYLVDERMTHEAKIYIFDNLGVGTLRNIKQWLNNPNFTFIKGDLINPSNLKKLKHEYYDLSSIWRQPRSQSKLYKPKHPTKLRRHLFSSPGATGPGSGPSHSPATSTCSPSPTSPCYSTD